MERLLARLERSFLGKLTIDNLTVFIVGGMAITFVLSMAKPEIQWLMVLDPALVTRQPWRLVSYLFLPESNSMIWVFFALYFFWLMGTSLEREWGAFKFNAFYLLGAIGTTVAALITGIPQGNTFLNMSVYFAFATLFPNFQVLLFFILPIRVKWLALVAAGYVALQFVRGDLGTKAAIAVAFANYFLFFGGHLRDLLKGKQIEMRQSARRARDFADVPTVTESTRSCAICGARQADGADIRVCSCDKCGGTARDLCLEHARNH